MSWPYDDLPGRLADVLGITRRAVTTRASAAPCPNGCVGCGHGHGAGDLDVALVCGAEALDTKRRLKKAGVRRPGRSAIPSRRRSRSRRPSPLRWPTRCSRPGSPSPPGTWPDGLGSGRCPRRVPPPHRRPAGAHVGVAARNPNAWFPMAHDVAELIVPAPRTAWSAIPTPDHDVDHGRGHGRRPDPGHPRGRRSAGCARRSPGLPAGWAEAHDAVVRGRARRPVRARPPWTAPSPGRWAPPGWASTTSPIWTSTPCFSSSVHFAADTLGLDPVGDGRSVTVTGGLPYAGGAASNYLAHAVATMVGGCGPIPVRSGWSRAWACT